MKKLMLALIFCSTVAQAQWQDGDLIFHQSHGRQAPALREATHSVWTHMGVLVQDKKKWVVYEAGNPVKITKLKKFIRKGLNKKYIVKRAKPGFVDLSVDENKQKLVSELRKFLKIPYDYFFEWSNDSIYCSELAWKSYFNAFGVAPGRVQTLGDLDLSGPNVQKLIAIRIKVKGAPFNLDEPIITPISVLESPEFETVFDNSLEEENL